jgi:hypothetical protein
MSIATAMTRMLVGIALALLLSGCGRNADSQPRQDNPPSPVVPAPNPAAPSIPVPAGWVRVAPPNAGFVAHMPPGPFLFQKPIVIPRQFTRPLSHSYLGGPSDGKANTYLIRVVVIPPDVTAEEREKELAKSLAEIAHKDSTKETKRGSATVDNVEAVEINLETNTGEKKHPGSSEPFWSVVRIVKPVDRMFICAAVKYKAPFTEAELQPFFANIRFVPFADKAPDTPPPPYVSTRFQVQFPDMYQNNMYFEDEFKKRKLVGDSVEFRNDRAVLFQAWRVEYPAGSSDEQKKKLFGDLARQATDEAYGRMETASRKVMHAGKEWTERVLKGNPKGSSKDATGVVREYDSGSEKYLLIVSRAFGEPAPEAVKAFFESFQFRN